MSGDVQPRKRNKDKKRRRGKAKQFKIACKTENKF